ncbi:MULTISPECIES: hypothetical protein [unclassified Streptomyces]|uniref:hypothetical protein n=1 Tax=unclassified Streptomyces TaxID=2593676 RepID=UPI00332EE367
MRQAATDEIICVTDWTPSAPGQLTTLAVSGERAEAAERVAAAALGGTAELTSWLELPADARRRLVGACRSVPTLGMHCVRGEERTGTAPDGFRQAAADDTAEQFLSRLPGRAADHRTRFVTDSSFPGLRELARLTALVCRETYDRTDVPEDEDLLEIYETYSVGSLSASAPAGG